MQATKILLLCFQAFLIQCISSQCLGPAYNSYADGLAWGAAANGLAWDAAVGPYGPYAAAPCAATWAAPYAAEWGAGYAPATLAASNGGGLAVSSASPIPASGVALTSENLYEGGLAVSGVLPFLGAVALEGALPTAGAGGVRYTCGNGNVGIVSEDIAGYNAFGPYGYGPGAELGYGYAPLAYETGIAGPYGYNGYRGCGCGALY